MEIHYKDVIQCDYRQGSLFPLVPHGTGVRVGHVLAQAEYIYVNGSELAEIGRGLTNHYALYTVGL